MKIDKDKIREVRRDLIKGNWNQQCREIALELAEQFLAGKIGEVKSKEEIEKIFDDKFGCNSNRNEAIGKHSNYSYQSFLDFILALVGKVGKGND